MANLNGIVRGDVSNVASETINSNTMYDLQDLQPISITNTQMTNALTNAKFYKKDSVWFCIDSGTYTQNHFYKFTVTNPYSASVAYSWTDLGGLGGGSELEVWTWNADTSKFTLGTEEKTATQFYTYYVANYTTKTIIVYSIESASATKGQTYGTGLIDTGNMLISLGNVSGDYTRELEIDGNAGTVTVTVANIQAKPTITTDSTSTTVSQTLASNNSYRYTSVLTSLTVSLSGASSVNDFSSEVVFTSGSTATTFTCSDTIQWSGDDVASNVFTPTTNKTYNIVFWYDSINLNAVVRGV